MKLMAWATRNVIVMIILTERQTRYTYICGTSHCLWQTSPSTQEMGFRPLHQGVGYRNAGRGGSPGIGADITLIPGRKSACGFFSTIVMLRNFWR